MKRTFKRKLIKRKFKKGGSIRKHIGTKSMRKRIGNVARSIGCRGQICGVKPPKVPEEDFGVGYNNVYPEESSTVIVNPSINSKPNNFNTLEGPYATKRYNNIRNHVLNQEDLPLHYDEMYTYEENMNFVDEFEKNRREKSQRDFEENLEHHDPEGYRNYMLEKNMDYRHGRKLN